jgi:hypothetical protein
MHCGNVLLNGPESRDLVNLRMTWETLLQGFFDHGVCEVGGTTVYKMVSDCQCLGVD